MHLWMLVTFHLMVCKLTVRIVSAEDRQKRSKYHQCYLCNTTYMSCGLIMVRLALYGQFEYFHVCLSKAAMDVIRP